MKRATPDRIMVPVRQRAAFHVGIIRVAVEAVVEVEEEAVVVPAVNA